MSILLVTGSSRGIGAATARLAGARGYDVAVNYLRDEKAADAVVKDAILLGAAKARPEDLRRALQDRQAFRGKFRSDRSQ